MTPDIFFLCVLAALIELDTTYVFQLTFSRGIIAGPIFGFFTGDLMAGIQVGIFAELLFADVNPLGGVLPPSPVICSAVTLAIYAMHVELYLAFVAGVLAALLFSMAEKYRRKSRFRWLVYWEQKIIQTPGTSLPRAVGLALISSFLINFLLLFVFIWLGGRLLVWLAPHIPDEALVSCKFAYMAVPWIGLAAMIPQLRLKMR